MKKRIPFLIVVLVAILWSSCRKDFDVTQLPTGHLEFEKDTIYLDTIFTGVSSSTYRFKVYNRGSEAIRIPNIHLAQGANSFYRINVDGRTGNTITNTMINAQDSLFVFVESTIDFAQVVNPLYEDKLLFDNDTDSQEVVLVSLVQDAHFLYPTRDALTGEIATVSIGVDSNGDDVRIEGFELPNDYTFTADKPWVIYGYCVVPDNKILTINAGTQVHFHNNSGLIVNQGASLQSNGTLANPVLIQGDRLEPEYEDIAAQWGIIWLRDGSVSNTINYTTIKNGTVGLLVESASTPSSAQLTLTNTQLYNFSNYGLLAQSASVIGENVVVNNCGQSAFAGVFGGNYTFTHCTFANYWQGGLRTDPAIYLSNYVETATGNVANDLQAANFTNCIIDGNNALELTLEATNSALFNYNFTNTMLKFDDYQHLYDTDPLYDFTNGTLFANCLVNEDADFRDAYENDLIIGNDSAGNGLGNASGASQVPTDILGVSRTASSDIGAYQHIIF